MNTKILLRIFGVLLLTKFSEQQIDPIKKTFIDTFIQNTFIPGNHIPGLSLAIVDETGQNLYSRGYGFLNLENGVPAENDTLFGIGSISKSFTAVIVVKTLTELFPQYGNRVLDTPISELLPPGSKRFILSDRFRSEDASFRDLLSHRTCALPENFALHVGADQENLIYRTRYAVEVCDYRTAMVYNNVVIALAGETIGVIANRTFESMMFELFADLGMTGTTIIRQSDEFENMPTLSLPYYYREGQFGRFNQELLKKVSIAPGSGGVLSNANDMVRYMTFHLNYGKLDGVQLVPEEAMRWLQEVSVQMPFNGWRTVENDKVTGDFGYGLGFFLGVYDGWKYSHHGGYLAPYNSYMSLYPDLKIGIFSSASGPGSLPSQTDHVNLLHPKILDILRETTTKNAIRNYPMENSLQKIGSNIFQRPNQGNTNRQVLIDELELVGHYGHAQSAELDISFKNGTSEADTGLYLNFGPWGTGFLRNTTTESVYALELDSDLIHEFYASEAGEIGGIFLDFRTKDFILIDFLGTEFLFERGLTLEKLPEVPWAPDSCGPDNN